MDPERLFLMGKILRYLYSNYGETSGNTQPTVHQVKAMRFLRQWGDECILASNLPSLEP